ncbi:hypothetical protein ACHQM5_018094 [Ranunculus cassubicifolius]
MSVSSLPLSSQPSLTSLTYKTTSFPSLHTPNFISLTKKHATQQLKNGGNRYQIKKMNRGGSMGAVCYSSPLSPQTIQWVSTISSAVLVLAKGTSIPKSFLVPLFALQAPANIIYWIKGEYGVWTAFLALLVRLFFFIPGELELPFVAMLLVLVSPYQVTNLRGTQGGAIASLLIAGYLAFQHFSRLGSLRKAFDQGSAIATTAIISITAAAGLLLL